MVHNPLLTFLMPSVSYTGVQECAGTDYQLCLRDVLSSAPGAAHTVHLRPHGILAQHQRPHRLCHSGRSGPFFFWKPPVHGGTWPMILFLSATATDLNLIFLVCFSNLFLSQNIKCF